MTPFHPKDNHTDSETRGLAAEAAEDRLVTVEREGLGESIIFWARTRNASEVAELDDLFNDLRAGCQVRILSRGPVMAAAVKVVEEASGDATELMRLLESVGERYSFSKVELGLNHTLNRLIEDMALESGSELSPPSSCSLCGRPEPFPTRLKLEGPREEAAEGQYCSRCVARFAEQNERDLVGALLHADRKTFAETDTLEVSPRPSRKGIGNRVSYFLKRRSPMTALG